MALQVFQQKIEMDRKALQTGQEVVPNLSDFIVNYFSKLPPPPSPLP